MPVIAGVRTLQKRVSCCASNLCVLVREVINLSVRFSGLKLQVSTCMNMEELSSGKVAGSTSAVSSDHPVNQEKGLGKPFVRCVCECLFTEYQSWRR